MKSLYLILSLILAWPITSLAEGHGFELEKDPFKQPDILKYKPPAPVRQDTADIDAEVEIPELELTATLISVTEPMVIVNQQWLRIGESIEGMKLILIDEGRAVFSHDGRQHEFTINQPEINRRR
ncbi:MAG: hypothetical protein QNJ56_03960 [Gammaproteobacteria bacterium]|nr:hypothetical protein [Gammaproteobacteria bacterium]